LETQPLATIVVTISAGVLSLILASKTKFPSILFFLAFGIFLGPRFANLIQPKILGASFPQVVSIMVALILFEGGISLKFSQFREISSIVRNLLTVGMLTTLAGIACAVHFVSGMSLTKSILFGAVMTISGPTVVIPILRRIRLKEKLHNILKWEAILIDPLGAVTAVVLFELLLSEKVGILTGLLLFTGRIGLGILMGILTGLAIAYALRHRWLLRLETEELGGLFVVGTNLLFYGISEWIAPHSGLVTATVAGIFIGNQKFPFQEQIFHFKKQVTLFALSVLFILLASKIPVEAIPNILREGIIIFLILVFVIRPLSVFLSTFRQPDFSWQEKIFISFLAPRGIVCASLASVFAIAFERKALTGRGIFLPLAFLIISGTIIFYALLSELLARILRAKEEARRGILIVGANRIGLLFAEELRKKNFQVQFVDTNPKNCQLAREKGFRVFEGSGFDKEFLESLDLKGIGKMLAMTFNHEVNVLCCQTFSGYLGRNAVYRLWDKTDSWDSVTAPTYDESWGKPLLITFSEKADFLKEKLYRDALTSASKETQEDLSISQNFFPEMQIDYPLFTVQGEEAFFPTPNAVIKGKSELVYARDKTP